MGSEHLYRAYAEYLRGISPADQPDLDAMNLRITIETFVITTSGYGENFGQTCALADISSTDAALLTPTQALAYASKVRCVPNLVHSANTNTSLISTFPSILELLFYHYQIEKYLIENTICAIHYSLFALCIKMCSNLFYSKRYNCGHTDLDGQRYGNLDHSLRPRAVRGLETIDYPPNSE
jgi:hypothetical protein